MTTTLSLPRRLQHGLAAASLMLASVAAHAQAFTFDPGAAGLTGSVFSADNILISDYATVTQTGPNTFSEVGFLSVAAFQLNNSFVIPAGLNSTYGLFFAFSGTGTNNGADPLTQPTSGSFTTLTYTLYGYNGTATFGFSGTTPTTTAASPVALASGTLVSGSVSSTPTGTSLFPSANATLTFAAASAAFVTPSTFYNQAVTAFTNTSNQVVPFAGGFMIQNGGGTISFATAVPEPASGLLLLAGLGAIGLLAQRRGARR